MVKCTNLKFNVFKIYVCLVFLYLSPCSHHPDKNKEYFYSSRKSCWLLLNQAFPNPLFCLSPHIGFARMWRVCVCVLVTQSCLTLCDPHGLKLTRLLCPWNCLGKNTGCAIPFSRGFSWPRDQNQVSHIAGRFFTIWVTREALCQYKWSRTVCIIFPCLLLKIFFPVIYKLCHSGPILFYSFSYNFIGL